MSKPSRAERIAARAKEMAAANIPQQDSGKSNLAEQSTTGHATTPPPQKTSAPSNSHNSNKTVRTDDSHLTKKEIAVLTIATALALPGLADNSPQVALPCIFVSWIVFLYLCYIHPCTKIWRMIAALVITFILATLGLHNFHPIQIPLFSLMSVTVDKDSGADELKVIVNYENDSSDQRIFV